MWQAFGTFAKSPIGPLFIRNKLAVNADGSFTIENMLPGDYQIFFSAPEASRNIAYRRIQVEPVIQPVFGRAAAGAESYSRRVDRAIRQIRFVFNRTAMRPFANEVDGTARGALA